jgi:hypothetical protein
MPTDRSYNFPNLKIKFPLASAGGIKNKPAIDFSQKDHILLGYSP